VQIFSWIQIQTGMNRRKWIVLGVSLLSLILCRSIGSLDWVEYKFTWDSPQTYHGKFNIVPLILGRGTLRSSHADPNPSDPNSPCWDVSACNTVDTLGQPYVPNLTLSQERVLQSIGTAADLIVFSDLLCILLAGWGIIRAVWKRSIIWGVVLGAFLLIIALALFGPDVTIFPNEIFDSPQLSNCEVNFPLIQCIALVGNSSRLATQAGAQWEFAWLFPARPPMIAVSFCLTLVAIGIALFPCRASHSPGCELIIKPPPGTPGSPL
jgi:hypothetical protein